MRPALIVLVVLLAACSSGKAAPTVTEVRTVTATATTSASQSATAPVGELTPAEKQFITASDSVRDSGDTDTRWVQLGHAICNGAVTAFAKPSELLTFIEGQGKLGADQANVLMITAVSNLCPEKFSWVMGK